MYFLQITVQSATGLLAPSAFLALSVTSDQYYHTSIRDGIDTYWNETFTFAVDPPGQLIVTAHHGNRSSAAPGHLCGQGILALSPMVLAEAARPGGKVEHLPLLLKGRVAGQVTLALASKPRAGHLSADLENTDGIPTGLHMDPNLSQDEQIRLLERHLQELEDAERNLLASFSAERDAREQRLSRLEHQVANAWLMHQQGPRPVRRFFAAAADEDASSARLSRSAMRERAASELSQDSVRSSRSKASGRPGSAPPSRCAERRPLREAAVPQLASHPNKTGTPRRVRPPGTREMLYTAPYNEQCDWGTPRRPRPRV